MPACSVLCDPIVSVVHCPQLSELLLQPLRILQIKCLRIIHVILPEQAGICTELRPRDAQQRKACQKAHDRPHAESACFLPGLEHEQNHCQHSKHNGGCRRRKYRPVGLYQSEPLLPEVSKMNAVELQHSRNI